MDSESMRKVLEPLTGAKPALVAGAALAVSGLSTYWDIATHVDGGRERFLTPPHIGIYSGVTVALVVIGLAMIADRLATGAALGAAVLHPFRDVRPGLAAAGTGMAVALVAAPIDNAWHEIYGIDITIWSPPHLLAIFGISIAALGLAMLVAPASGDHRPLLHHFLLSSFLAGLIVSTGEFEFNGPQYRIAYHPMIVSAAAGLVLVAAARGPHRWGATRVAALFEGARILSVIVLVVLDHSLPFVPLLLPTAIAADLLGPRLREYPFVAGAALGGITVVCNVALLEVLETITWRGDDLLYGGIGALLVSALAAYLGLRLGGVLAGVVDDEPPRTLRRGAAATAVVLAVLAPTAALAHEVGGDAGTGLIAWEPHPVSVGEDIEVRIEDLEIASGADVGSLRLEAWRAEHRIDVPLARTERDYSGRFSLPEEGPWMLLIRVRAGEEALLTTQQMDVTSAPAGDGSHRERFTLGLDTLAGSDPPAWLDALAYLVSLSVLGLLIRGLLRSLRRMGAQKREASPSAV